MTMRTSDQPTLIVLDAQAVWLRAVETIAAEAGFTVTTTSSPAEALRLLARGGFDLLMVGVDAGGESLGWPQLLARSKKLAPSTRLVLVGDEDGPDMVRRALDAGADAYVTRRVEPDDPVFALRQVVAPALYLVWPFSRGRAPAARDATRFGLTRREGEVLELVARGCSNAEIARELGITEQTVKGHLWRLYRKLGVSNRTAAARLVEQADARGASAFPVERA